MIPFADIATRARDTQGWELRVRGALVMRARVAFLAGPGGGKEAEYSYAIGVLRDPMQFSALAAWALATDPAIVEIPLASTVTDAQITTAMNVTWPFLALLR